MGSDEGHDELIELEHRWMEAVRDRDIDFLERLLAAEFTLTTGRPGAEVRNREEWLAVTRDTYVIEEFAFDELHVDVYPGAAVVRSRYHQRGRMGDADRTQPFLMTDVFIRRDDGWVAVTRHLTPLPPARGLGGEQVVPGSVDELRRLLLDPEEAERLDAHGRTEAAVLMPMHGWPDHPGLVFTERRSDLRRHAGEISFPGGSRDPEESLLETALREAEEEIGLSRENVEIAGALPPIGTFVTSYKIHPFVGLIAEGMRFEPNPAEVESVLVASLEDLAAGHEKRRLVRRGVPIKTETYLISDKLIWGATARILGDLFRHLGRPLR